MGILKNEGKETPEKIWRFSMFQYVSVRFSMILDYDVGHENHEVFGRKFYVLYIIIVNFEFWRFNLKIHNFIHCADAFFALIRLDNIPRAIRAADRLIIFVARYVGLEEVGQARLEEGIIFFGGGEEFGDGVGCADRKWRLGEGREERDEREKCVDNHDLLNNVLT